MVLLEPLLSRKDILAMRTIGLINWKGGVGKTSTALNTACLFANSGLKILVVDADKQGNISTWFGADPSGLTLADILLDGTDASEVIQHTRYENIDIIPSDASLIQANYEVLKDKSKAQHDILKRSLESVKGNYHICIIDNPPDSNIPVLNCLLVMDDIIAVTLPNRFSLAGIHQLQMELNNYNQALHLSLKVRGVVINQYTTECTDIFNEIASKYKIFPTIRGGRNTQKWLDRVINNQKSIFEVCPNSGYARDIKRFGNKLAEVIEADATGQEVLW
ncbi:MAG: AAA family ATPase [Selenomonas sp.]|nr:AAA family ATPase [Selenomonas sp.]